MKLLAKFSYSSFGIVSLFSSLFLSLSQVCRLARLARALVERGLMVSQTFLGIRGSFTFSKPLCEFGQIPEISMANLIDKYCLHFSAKAPCKKTFNFLQRRLFHIINDSHESWFVALAFSQLRAKPSRSMVDTQLDGWPLNSTFPLSSRVNRQQEYVGWKRLSRWHSRESYKNMAWHKVGNTWGRVKGWTGKNGGTMSQEQRQTKKKVMKLKF